MALLYADTVTVVTPDSEIPNHDGMIESQQLGSPDIVGDIVSLTASSDSPSEPRDSPLTLDDTLVEGIRNTTADTEFLDELGLSADDYRQLLEVVDFILLDDKDEDED